MQRIVLLFLIGLVPVFSWTQTVDREQVEQSIKYLHLEEAVQLSAQLSPEKDAPYYQSRILFLQFLITEDPTLWPLYLSHAKSSISTLDKLPDRDPEKKVMMAELFFLRGVGKMIDKKYIGSALDIKSACKLLDQNRSAFPENVEQRKLLGIFQVAMNSIPRKLRWLSNALCFRGDLDQGLEDLEVASRESKLMAAEAEVMLFYFEKNLLSEPEKAFERVEQLLVDHPGSPIFSYFKLSALLEARKVDNAIAFCQVQEPVIFQDEKVSDLPLWYYSRAKAHYFKLEFGPAIKYFDSFLARYKGKTLYSDALFRKGMSLVLQDRYPEARRIFHQMAEVESSTFDEDEYACRMAAIYRFQEPTDLDKDLFRARNLFDGGYYQQSLELLDKVQGQGGLNENQKAELYYRLGRNFQATELPEQAESEYLKCIATEPGQALWMKVYAHYYLGQLAEGRSDTGGARTYYKTALGFDDYDYQSGLEQRCKAAIHRLKNQKDSSSQ